MRSVCAFFHGHRCHSDCRLQQQFGPRSNPANRAQKTRAHASFDSVYLAATSDLSDRSASLVEQIGVDGYNKARGGGLLLMDAEEDQCFDALSFARAAMLVVAGRRKRGGQCEQAATLLLSTTTTAAARLLWIKAEARGSELHYKADIGAK